MEANEAPDKIYVSNYSSGLPYNWHNERLAVNDIEYIRKDAFIDRACEYLMEYEFNDSPTITDRRKRVEDFVNYMKGGKYEP